MSLENREFEPSPTTAIEVMMDTKRFRLQRIGDCQGGSGSNNITTCNLYLDKNYKSEFPLEIAPINPIQPDVDEIAMTVRVTASCLRETNLVLNKELKVSVVQSWSVEAEQDLGQEEREEIPWSHESQEETLPRDLIYSLTNKGPSISTPTQVYVFLPRHHLIQRETVRFANQNCSEGDEKNLQRPPVLRASNDRDTMTLACSVRGDCLVYQCPVPGMQRFDRTKLRVNYEFNSKLAEQEGQGATRFEVWSSVCVLQRDSQICADSGKVVTTRTVFQYFPQTTLDVLIDYWQVLVAVGAAIIVFIAVLLLAWKFELFQRVRIVKKNNETKEESEKIPMESQSN